MGAADVFRAENQSGIEGVSARRRAVLILSDLVVFCPINVAYVPSSRGGAGSVGKRQQ
jgi:hypothetical protein